MNDKLDALALEYPCWYCKAGIHSWCVTKSGGRAYWLHSARQNPIRLAWLEGYHQGYIDHEAFTVRKLDSIA